MIGGLTWPDARRGQADHLCTMSWRVLEGRMVKTAPQCDVRRSRRRTERSSPTRATPTPWSRARAYSLGAALRKQNLAGHSRFLPHTQHGACFLTLKPHTWMFSGRRCEGYSGGAPGLCGGAQAPSAGSSSTHEKSKKERSAATFAARLMMPTTSPMSRRHGAQAFYTLCSNPTELRWTAPSPQRVFS